MKSRLEQLAELHQEKIRAVCYRTSRKDEEIEYCPNCEKDMPKASYIAGWKACREKLFALACARKEGTLSVNDIVIFGDEPAEEK